MNEFIKLLTENDIPFEVSTYDMLGNECVYISSPSNKNCLIYAFCTNSGTDIDNLIEIHDSVFEEEDEEMEENIGVSYLSLQEALTEFKKAVLEVK